MPDDGKKAERLDQCLKELHLPTVRRCYQDEAITARRDNWDYETYLYELAAHECEERHHNRITRLLGDSKLPLEKSLKTFERKRLPRKVDAQLNLLIRGDFLEHRENVLAFGNPGSGKTHLLCAIAQELVHQGRRVRYTPCCLLVQELLIAKRDLKLARVLKQYAKYEALIIDDIGYVQQSREEMEVLFTLLADRYERSSVMLTSNLPFSQWERIFKDPMTTAAAIDRLVHHSVILELNLSSYRLEQSQKTKETMAVASASAALQESSPHITGDQNE
jgi:DNA replication protein DnaC